MSHNDDLHASPASQHQAYTQQQQAFYHQQQQDQQQLHHQQQQQYYQDHPQPASASHHQHHQQQHHHQQQLDPAAVVAATVANTTNVNPPPPQGYSATVLNHHGDNLHTAHNPGSAGTAVASGGGAHGGSGDTLSNQAEFLHNFWSEQMNTAERSEPDFKVHPLPLARIKKVMKSDSDVKQMISAEAPMLFSKACEIFITELTLRAWMHAEENKRRTLQRSDVSSAVGRSDQFDFLIDIVPRDEQGKARRVKEEELAYDAGGAYYYATSGQPYMQAPTDPAAYYQHMQQMQQYQQYASAQQQQAQPQQQQYAHPGYQTSQQHPSSVPSGGPPTAYGGPDGSPAPASITHESRPAGYNNNSSSRGDESPSNNNHDNNGSSTSFEHVDGGAIAGSANGEELPQTRPPYPSQTA